MRGKFGNDLTEFIGSHFINLRQNIKHLLAQHALGVLLYHSLTASCAVRWPLSKLRTQLNTVQRVGAFCPHMADIRDEYLTV
jgi:hypothetical protein